MSLKFNGTGGIWVSQPTNITVEYPFSMSCWFFPQDDSTQQRIMGFNTPTSAGSGFRLVLMGDLAGDPLRAQSQAFSTFSAADQTGVVFDQWNFGVAVFVAAADRKISVNAQALHTNTVSRTIDRTVVNFCFGQKNDSNTNEFTGYIAHAAVWNTALVDSEIATLYSGTNPLSLKRASVLAYWPFTNPGAQTDISPTTRAQGFLPGVPTNSGPASPSFTGVSYSNWNPPVHQMTQPKPRRIFYSLPASSIIPVLYQHRQQQGMAA